MSIVIFRTFGMGEKYPFLGMLLFGLGLALSILFSEPIGFEICLGVTFMVLGLNLFFSITTVEYNRELRRLRIAKDYGLFRLGSWIDIKGDVKVQVAPERTQTSHQTVRIGVNPRWNSGLSNLFNINLLNLEEKPILIAQFNERSDAISKAKKLAKQLGKELEITSLKRESSRAYSRRRR